ncbi:MAG: hypothetical protein RBU27_06945 [Bacteroidota bacterium]|jgi:thiol-disulfide isomerase/thioredoxin|nr:hypothetical protein [Bacteroidota bacterium]
MKRFLCITAILLFTVGTAARAQDAPVLTGPIGIADLLDLPGWFGEDFLSYTPMPVYLADIPRHIEDVEILCFLGTWCSDSRREVPRMIRLLQATNRPPETMRMIGLDRAKRSPDALEARYAIERVPTFIFFRDGEEIGRIVEAPLGSLEKDMLGIIDPDAGKGDGTTPPERDGIPVDAEGNIPRDDGSMEVEPPSDADAVEYESGK